MVKNILKKIIASIEKITNWKIIIIPKETELRPSAVKSDIGFWYAGKVVDEKDISYGILRNGVVEVFETNLVLKILKQMNTSLSQCNFYDIGANSGYYGILAAYAGNGKTNTYSFEPLSEYSSLIEESVNLNRLEDKVNVFKHALGATPSTDTMQLSGSGSSLKPGFLGKQDNLPTREITIEPLDTVVDKSNLPPPHFIKIDVEGFEYEVLKGGLDVITKTQPILFIEIAGLLKTGYGDFKNEHASDIFDLLHGLGYNAFVINDSVKSVTDIVPENGVFMYLFLNKNNHQHKAIRAII